jgi:aquaporin Z
MDIKAKTGSAGWKQLTASWKKNRKHYAQEAVGLSIFMISACFFGAVLEGQHSSLHHAIQNDFTRTVIMGVLMGSTALFIFYSPLTAPSGSHINPAVSLTFWRLGKLCHWDLLFYIMFQFIGGTITVYIMEWLMGELLTAAPVNSVITVPGKAGVWPALITELLIAFITMTMVLFTSDHSKLKYYTRMISGGLVCTWVITAGPLSGFGMNPARSFASALPAHIWTAFWIYMIVPAIGMLLAAEVFLFVQRKKTDAGHRKYIRSVSSPKELMEPLEFLL